MNFPKLAVNRPVTTIMMLVSIFVIGGIAASRMKLALLPEVDAPFIGVQIPYPNSNPWNVEREIVKPVEEALATLSGIKTLHANANADSAEVFMEFDWGQDLDIIRMQVSEKIEQVKPTLPAGVGQVLIFSFNTNDIPVIEARIAAEGVDLSKNYELIEARVLNRLRRVPGVARVDLDGVAPREINIDLILDKVKQHNIDITGLMRRLQGASSNMVLGEVNEGGLRYTVRALGSFSSVEEFEKLPVNERGLKLGDIANIRYEEPPIDYGRHLDGKYAVALNVFKESTANTVDVVRAGMKVINEDIASDPLLKGMKVFTWQDQAEQIVGGVRGVTESGTVGGLLAILILYYFLRRLKSTLIVAMSIPFSIIAAMGVMSFMGKTLNVLSMMGLMLGVGMLVDNAIVVLEAIDRRQRDEKNAKKAAFEGASSVAMAVAASTLTTLIVFLPLIVGGKNELTIFLGEVGIAISLAVICSLLSSLTIIPLMAAHYLEYKEPKRIKAMEWLEERYVRMLGWTLDHRWKMFFIVLGVIALTVLPIATGLVKSGIFSARKNDRIRLQYEFKEFSYKSKSEQAVNRIEAFLNRNAKQFGIAGLYSWYADSEAATTITLERPNMSDDEIAELRKAIRKDLPVIAGVRVYFREDSEEGGNTRSFAVKFFGQDSTVLQRLATEAERRLDTIEGIEDIDTGLGRGRQEIQVRIDRERARRMGLTAQDISDIFAFTLGGTRLRRFNAGEHEVETWLALRRDDRENLDDLQKLQIRTQSGQDLLLGDIASFETVKRAESIRRENRKVRVAVRANYEGEDWDEVRKEITEQMDAFSMPAGYSWSWDDRIIEQDSQGRDMLINVLLALALVYIVMASLFESLAQPFAILFSIPFALPGCIWFLAATRTPFNLMAQIGILILMGIVVNNGIVLLDHKNQLRRDGMGEREAILQAGRDRLRAILMTASTTIIGLLPLALGGSTVGGLFYFPLARTVMGGLLSSTFLTLLILPLIDLGVERMAASMRRLWVSSSPDAVDKLDVIEPPLEMIEPA